MRRALFLVAVLALLVPSGAATWRVAGTFEPDTPYDDASWMFQDPPPPGSKRVYFNGMTTSGLGVAISPNVALLETRNEAPVLETQVALLGVWADCNGDGYIGMAEHGIREYSASLLLSTAVCPPVTGSASKWVEGAHNYNGWVSEFLFIGRAGSQRIFLDTQTRVWGDYERPDHDPILGQCPLTPHPRGTYQSTGGLLNFYVGCRLDQKGIEWARSFNQAMDAIGDPLGLKFANEYDATSGRLGQQATFGSEDTAHSPAYVWDCEEAPTTVGATKIYAVDPRVGNSDPTKWTLPALYNHTYEGIHPENCDTSDDRDSGFYVLEDDYHPVSPRNKTEADWNFKFAAAGRGGPPLGGVSPGGAGAPSDAGVGWLGTSSATIWGADNAYGSKLGPNLVRGNLGGVQLASAFYASFYAYVGSTTTGRGHELPSSSVGVYGSWQCGDETSGIHHGWNCDPDAWNRNPDGTAYPNDIPRVVVGAPYQLRDVDCYDGNNALGVPLGLPGYGTDACA